MYDHRSGSIRSKVLPKEPDPAEAAIETLLARSAVYQALAMVLRRPDTETATWLARREPQRLAPLIAMLNGSAAARQAAEDLAGLLERINLVGWTRDHERLFGHTVQASPSPYELEYGPQHSYRQPLQLADITAFYQAFGLRLRQAASERADHIAVECEFLHVLLYKEACALDEARQDAAEVCAGAARSFLTDHLGQWAVAFATRLAQTAASPLFEAVARLLSAWLVDESQRLGITLGSDTLPLRPFEEPHLSAACDRCPTPSAGPCDTPRPFPV